MIPNWEANTEAAISRIELGIRTAREDLLHLEEVCVAARRMLESGDFRGVEKCFEEIHHYLNKEGEVF